MRSDSKTVLLKVPDDFSLRSTVYSHGWCQLAPFRLDEANCSLRYVFREGECAVPAVIFESSGNIVVRLEGRIDGLRVARDIRRMLRIDEDLSSFYATVASNERLGWISRERAGRLLRSPTVWEDLVKTICTTNCSWALTKKLVSNLVEKLGASTFPSPEVMACVDEGFYRDQIKAGYRSRYLVDLAEAVASGKLDPEAWLSSELPTPELRKEILMIKGVGDYAADNLLKLLGRYEGLALDSWLRSQFYKTHNSDKVCSDNQIKRHYEKFGEWRGLAIWCDMSTEG